MISGGCSRQNELRLPSDRSFGVVFSTFFALVAFLPLLSGKEARYWAVVPAILTAIVSVMKPSALHRANLLWARCGAVLQRVFNPVILAILYYAVMVPLGIMARMLRQDPLHLKFNPHADSYWVRPEKSETSASMINQF